MKKQILMVFLVLIAFSGTLGAEEAAQDPALAKAYKVIEQQGQEIQDLRYERERLLAEIKDLNETINDIRSRVGGGGYQPN